MEDSTFRFFAMFPLLLATFVNYLIPFLIKPAVLLVNLLTEFSVGSIYLGFQLAALFINFVAFVFFGGFSSEFSLPHRVFCRVPPQVYDLSSDAPRGRASCLLPRLYPS